MTPAPAIVVEDVTRTYSDGATTVEALRGVSARVAYGDFVALQGPSGSGKSTLLNIVGLLDRATDGSVEVGGADVSGLSDKALSARRATTIGFIFQSFHLLGELNVIDNVALGLLYAKASRLDRYRQAHSLLGDLGLSHRMTAMPGTLSGGERQRVAIARALMGDKQILICDEPTGNLDRQNTESLLVMFRRMASEGLAVVVATHDPRVAAAADTVLEMIDGRFTTEESA